MATNLDALPVDLTSQHLAIVGKTGSGKTYTAKRFVERLLDAKRRVCILDPTGVWYGLRSSVDGKRPGYPVAVFGGQHADVPIAAQSGAAVARIVATKNLPAIVDLSEMLIGDRHRFVTDFAEALYRDNREPLHLVIDEADEFSPQNPLPETKRMLHHVDRIVRRGRVRGFRVMMITQRPAVLHKNVLTQCNALIAMRLTAPQDRKALQAWVEGQADAGQAKEVLNSLAQLKRAEGWVWAPEHSYLQRTQFPAIVTFDSGRTPDDTAAATEPTHLAAVDLGEIRSQFEEVQQDLRAVPELKAEIEALKRRLTAADKIKGGFVPEAEVQRRVREAVAAAPKQPTADPGAIKALQQIAKLVAPYSGVRVEGVALGPLVREATAVRAPRQREAIVAPTPGPVSAGVKAPQQRLLDALAWWAAAGVTQPTRHQVAFVAGYTVNGHFNNQCGDLRARGLIDYPGGGALGLLPAGDAVANKPDAKPTHEDLIRRVLAVLKGEPQRRVFQVLVDAGGPLTRDELAARCDYTVNGHFNNLCGALNGIGVAEYPSKGMVGLSPIFRELGNG